MLQADSKNGTIALEVNPIRVMIVDDHGIVREGLCALLGSVPGFLLVGQAASGAEAVRLCPQVHPDVVLMDIVMTGSIDGIGATRAIHQSCPNTHIIALTSFGGEDLVREMMLAGATSYLIKEVSSDMLIQAVRAAHMGRRTLSPAVTQTLIDAMTHPNVPGYDLTPREREVLALLAEGRDNAAIADRLFISVNTVRNHLGSIFTKLGVSNRSEAMAFALKHRLVRLD